MKRAITAMAVLAAALAAGGAPAQSPEADARWERIQAERAAEAARRREAQERYEQGVRDAEAARRRYEAEVARSNQEVARARAAQADYERRRAEYEAQVAGQTGRGRRNAEPAATSDRRSSRANADPLTDRQRCQRRARGRGRAIGGIVGGIAGGVVGRNNPAAAIATALPVSLLLGEAITRLLDCREQEQAAEATEQVVEQATARQTQAATGPTRTAAGQTQVADSNAQRAVGTTVNWTSETRPGVTGSSTVTALEQEPGGGECMTVTDIVIVDGQETRAPKRLCRRPPSQRFVRV